MNQIDHENPSKNAHALPAGTVLGEAGNFVVVWSLKLDLAVKTAFRTLFWRHAVCKRTETSARDDVSGE